MSALLTDEISREFNFWHRSVKYKLTYLLSKMSSPCTQPFGHIRSKLIGYKNSLFKWFGPRSLVFSLFDKVQTGICNHELPVDVIICLQSSWLQFCKVDTLIFVKRRLKSSFSPSFPIMLCHTSYKPDHSIYVYSVLRHKYSIL